MKEVCGKLERMYKGRFETSTRLRCHMESVEITKSSQKFPFKLRRKVFKKTKRFKTNLCRTIGD